jgi:transposase InsO family protein
VHYEAKQQDRTTFALQHARQAMAKVASDLFQYKKEQYILIVDYYSRYIEISRLEKTTSGVVINHMKSIFSKHGIPEMVISDNGPQYSAAEFTEFSNDYGFTHVTSSPKHPSGNGEG